MDFHYDYTYDGLCDIGRQRHTNQDELLLAPQHNLFGVSDGMGGLPKGGMASAFVRDTLPELIGALVPDMNPALGFRDALAMMSDQLFEHFNRTEFVCGATFTGVLLLGDNAYCAHIGDSRCYHLSGGMLRQITDDQNLAAQWLRNGMITADEAKQLGLHAKLTAFVGMEAPAVPKLYEIPLQPGDTLLLCSDGMYGMLEDWELAELMDDGICRRMIDLANQRGGMDNISAVWLRIGRRKRT